uniref:Pre-mRNA-splicing factor Syf1/CRNKL1-like C-terminal HAT-repeats domain-containing protein n=1 Tax=Clastoptera arizonana TaxID=38151 RepID=A0A1B6DWD4_9HEMI
MKVLRKKHSCIKLSNRSGCSKFIVEDVKNIKQSLKPIKNIKRKNIPSFVNKDLIGKEGNLHRWTIKYNLPHLPLFEEFDWSVNLEHCFCKNAHEESKEEEEHLPVKHTKKLTRLEKLTAAKETESKLREIEMDLLKLEHNPQSADQFDRIILANPENAALWIKYMAFHLQATEIDKARAVARRALQTISHHNEGEKFNIWVALLNLENNYGSEENLKSLFEEALKKNDEYLVYSTMIEMYSSGNKIYDAEVIAKIMIKKFRTEHNSWLHIIKVFMKYQMFEKARSFYMKAAQHLTKKEYVNLTVQFAKLESECGFASAHALYENILISFPDRIDIWMVYIDILIKENNIHQARNIIQRAISLKLPIKKMKSLYSKWLNLEEKFGNEDDVKRVKEAAFQYINNVSSILTV